MLDYLPRSCLDCRLNACCPCGYSYGNAACLTINKQIDMALPLEAQILKAIVETMDCDKCPCACSKRKHSSKANCMMNWSDTLSQISSDCDWKDIRMQIITRDAKEGE